MYSKISKKKQAELDKAFRRARRFVHSYERKNAKRRGARIYNPY